MAFLTLTTTGCGPDLPPLEIGQAVFERTVGGLACVDCHGESATPRENADWRLPGAPLAGVGGRDPLWGGRFGDDLTVEHAAMVCAAKFQFRDLEALLTEPKWISLPCTPQELKALGAYIRSFEGPPDAIPRRRVDDVDAAFELVGDPDRGELVWAATCAVCHGSDAEGGLGPGLRGKDAVDGFDLADYVRQAADDDDVHAWMPPFGPGDLSTQDLADLMSRYAE